MGAGPKNEWDTQMEAGIFLGRSDDHYGDSEFYYLWHHVYGQSKPTACCGHTRRAFTFSRDTRIYDIYRKRYIDDICYETKI